MSLSATNSSSDFQATSISAACFQLSSRPVQVLFLIRHAQENDETLYEHRKNNSIGILLCKAVLSQSLLALVISSAWLSIAFLIACLASLECTVPELEELRCFTVYVVPLDYGCSQRVCCCDVPHVLSARPLEGLGFCKLIHTLSRCSPSPVSASRQSWFIPTAPLAGVGFPAVV